MPSVGNFRQGMLVSIPLHLDALPEKPDAPALAASLGAYYADGLDVRVAPYPGVTKIEPESFNDTNLMELSVHAHADYRHGVLVAKLDNLGKGASGAAVQNLKLMLDLH